MEENRNAFDEYNFQALTALGSLMTTAELCREQRAVMKISRFRQWLVNLQKQVTTKTDDTEK